ncbi:MAG: hypothetical protein ACLTTU_09395 [Bilophila wadsworthia]
MDDAIHSVEMELEQAKGGDLKNRFAATNTSAGGAGKAAHLKEQEKRITGER